MPKLEIDVSFQFLNHALRRDQGTPPRHEFEKVVTDGPLARVSQDGPQEEGILMVHMVHAVLDVVRTFDDGQIIIIGGWSPWNVASNLNGDSGSR